MATMSASIILFVSLVILMKNQVVANLSNGTSGLDNTADLSVLCPIGRKGEKVYEIPPKGKKLNAVSYMAHSRQIYSGNPNHTIVWIGSDGPQNEINALDIETGGILQSYVLDVPIQGDWESISLGPCDSSGRKSCLFIGNMGNNKAGFCTNTSCTYGVQTVYIYKLEEPNINAAYNDTALKVSTLAINYEGSNFPTNRANSEALFVDHTGDLQGGQVGDIYFATKFFPLTYLQRLGKISVEEHENLSPGSLKTVKIKASAKFSSKLTWTDATMNPEGNLITLRSYQRALYYPRAPWQTVSEALGGTPCSYKSVSMILNNDQRRYESISFMPFPYYVEASECWEELPCVLNVTRYKLLFPPSSPSFSLPPTPYHEVVAPST